MPHICDNIKTAKNHLVARLKPPCISKINRDISNRLNHKNADNHKKHNKKERLEHKEKKHRAKHNNKYRQKQGKRNNTAGSNIHVGNINSLLKQDSLFLIRLNP